MTKAKRRRADGRNTALTVFGVGLLVIGLACLGWVGWQFYGTNLASQQAYDEGRVQLQERWQEPRPEPGQDAEEVRIPGDAIGLLRIPAFGPDYEVPILAGTDPETLTRGVGWYESAVEPGEVGNFSVAGHRVTHGEPFRQLLELDAGDVVEVETRDAVFRYELIGAPRDLTVTDTDTWVLAPDPIERSDEASEPIMTLTTCQDLFRSPDRSVAFARLVETTNK
ncbi:class E sortase [Auraticoccus monumenti]|uniref:Sortase A n=1 Tax=Auraticoccus monumenti TaxID=675864 RepID=A0A1G6W4C7_9ACTN|nr:class E sortase [Auraticoccus monumenti]SDD59876.1 sortase A [Auraticoccus monumenti]